jgi:transposase InsO family protein
MNSFFHYRSDWRERRAAEPERTIFNTDQGSQFTAEAFTSVLRGAGITISMDGRGRCIDNVFVERVWRSLPRAIHHVRYL